MSWLDQIEDRVNDLLNALERIAAALERITELEAKRDELRKALDSIATDPGHDAQWLRDMARAALERPDA
jgi:hypothetical protein